MAVNGLALAGFVSCAGDVVGDVLGARAGVHYFRRPPGFCQQRTNDPRVWADEFEIGLAIATGLGAASSSCSYAAVAAARSAIQQGAALVPALALCSLQPIW